VFSTSDVPVSFTTADIPQAFSCFSYHISSRRFLVCDLQAGAYTRSLYSST
jgi:hypothetical protein